ncbi:uncharacterized protein LOC136081657 [Hydra vulgaris]|uniref:Uncharacterized protein LOC136081657 n=1 Tax=Hydra vulgaris TaxID=6087 RepID=A0ABM4C1D3_HYDVU
MFLLLFYFSAINLIQSEEDQIKTFLKLKKILLKPPSEAWSYTKYKTLKDLYLSEELINKGIENEGILSKQAIESQLEKAAKGINVMLYVIGESVSVGSELGEENQKYVFHNALANWWNNTIGVTTGSQMVRRVIAVGGVSSMYFEKCLQEYVTNNDTFDIILWEFNINDGALEKEILQKTLQKLIFKLYRMHNRVDLIFIVFYDRSLFEKKITTKHKISETVILDMAIKYSLTSLNIEQYAEKSQDVGEKELITGKHPSILAHAQMSLLIIKYYTIVMLNAIEKIITQQGSFSTNIKMNAKDLMNDFENNSICWTGVNPDFNSVKLKHSLFDLPAKMTKGFTKVTKAWNNIPEKRVDYTGGYVSKVKNETLEIKFNIENKSDFRDTKLYIAYRFDFANCSSLVKVSNKNVTKTLKIQSGEIPLGLTVKYVGLFPIGKYTLQVQTEKGGINICSIIIT